jgi:hypothetical protein
MREGLKGIWERKEMSEMKRNPSVSVGWGRERMSGGSRSEMNIARASV